MEPPDRPSSADWWQVAFSRAYAAHMRTAGFFDAVGELLAEATTSRTTVMCSEAARVPGCAHR